MVAFEAVGVQIVQVLLKTETLARSPVFPVGGNEQYLFHVCQDRDYSSQTAGNFSVISMLLKWVLFLTPVFLAQSAILVRPSFSDVLGMSPNTFLHLSCDE